MRQALIVTLPARRALNAAAFVGALLLFTQPLGANGIEVLPSALEPAGNGGLPALDRALAKLATHRRLLIIGAHPDDEDTHLLALVSRGQGGEAAYLSLSRGEGGQNLVGPELGTGLGLLRTEELLAARRIDGARQVFTRAFDFGYSRSLAETLEQWPQATLAEDTVRVIRRFQPQVIVSVFGNDGSGGHGQHQAAGLVAHEAFRQAADPRAFPDLALELLAPWESSALYREAWFRPEAATLTLEAGILDWLSGRTLAQLAAASRSMHRSQDMGRLQEIGPRPVRLTWVAGSGGAEARDLFAGIDTSLAAIAPPGSLPRLPAQGPHPLARVEELARAARRAAGEKGVGAAVPALAEIVRTLRSLLDRDAYQIDPRQLDLRRRGRHELIWEKLEVAQGALAIAAGLAFEAVVEREEAVPGEAVQVQAAVANGGAEAVEVLAVLLSGEFEEDARRSGRARIKREARAQGKPLPAGELASFELAMTVPESALPTRPYYLARPLQGALYDLRETPPELLGEPADRPSLIAQFHLRIGGETVTVEREVVHRFADQARGEIRRPFRIVPAVEVTVEPRLVVWPLAAAEERKIEVSLLSHAPGPIAGQITVELPPGFPPVDPLAFELASRGTTARRTLALRAPEKREPGRHRLRVTADLGGKQRFNSAYPLIDYPHIRPTPLPLAAECELVLADLALPRLRRVGYVRGAADRVPELLAAVGVPLELLGAAELAAADFARYDAIVLGSRAYESEPALAAANARLLDHVRGGGLLIVQYQQYPFVEGKFAPLALEIARPHDRITDERSPVELLLPNHPVFQRPNRFSAADWEGWVQERGLYLARSWDPAFEPLLAMTDPGQSAQRGGLLIAPLGRGTYVYTGIAFFRQLPAGVPGAYRLLANLLALAESDEKAKGTP